MDRRPLLLVLTLFFLFTISGAAAPGYDSNATADTSNLTVSYTASQACDLDCNISLRTNAGGYNGTLLGYNITLSFNDTNQQHASAELNVNNTSYQSEGDLQWNGTGNLDSNWTSTDQNKTWFLNLTLSNVTPVSKVEVNQSFRWDDDNTTKNTSIANNITLGNEPPRINRTAPMNDPVYINKSTLVNATVEDANTPLNVTMSLFNGSGRYNLSGANESYAIDGDWDHTGTINPEKLADGNYTLNITANDSLRAAANRSSSVTIDTTTPTIYNLSLNITGNQTDPHNGAIRLLGDLNETNVQTGQDCTVTATDDHGTWEGTITDCATSAGSADREINATFNEIFGENDSFEGNLTMSVSYTDKAGNTGSNSSFYLNGTTTRNDTNTSVWVDNRAPNVTVNPTNASYTNDENQTVTVDIQDLSNISSSINLTMNDNDFDNSSNENMLTVIDNNRSWPIANVTLNNTNLTEEVTHDLSVAVEDSFGQRTDYSWEFYTDYTAPSLNLTDVFGDQTDGWYHPSLTLEYTCTESYSKSQIRNRTVERGSTLINHTSTSGLINVTEDASVEGTFNYTLTCTDLAGNTNRTYSEQQFDNKAPTMTVNEPEDLNNTESTDYDLDIDLTINDGGSGFNATKYSDEDEVTEDFDVDSIDFSNENRTVDITGEYTFTDYEDEHFDVDIKDLVEQDLNPDDFEFELFEPEQEGEESSDDQSSGGGGGGGGRRQTSTSYDLSLDVPSTVDIDPDEGGSFEATIENNGGAGRTVLELDLPEGLSADYTDALFISAEDSWTQTVNMSVEDGFTGGEGTMTASISDSTTSSRTITFELAEDPAALDIGVDQGTINVTRGTTVSLAPVVTNTGDLEAGNVSAQVNRSGQVIQLEPASATLDGDELETFTTNISTSDLTVGVYDIVVTASSESTSATRSISLKVQPADEQEAEDVETRIQELEEHARSANASSEVLEQLQQAQQAAESGDYAQAAELADQADQQLPDPGLLPDIGDLPLPSTRTAGTVIGVLALLGILGGGAILYRDRGGYSSGTSPGRYLDRAGGKVSGQLQEMHRKISYRENEEHGEDSGQKRVRFADD